MQIHTDDKGRSGYIITNVRDALECLAIIEARVRTDEWDNHLMSAAANGLDRWLQKQIAAEAR